ncbi:aldose 1-epimerase [Pseudomonas marginalis]|uniref:aldose epimerase family protein n=1 Tax=Pseudomonas TaxID=286 RepID=UPI00381EEA20
MKRVELKNKTWSLALIPEWGGRVALLQATGLDIVTPITSESFDPVAWPKGGIYPLMPYSNRIRDSRLAHGGITHALPPHPEVLPHTLHGVSQTLPWLVANHSERNATLTCDYDGEHWPWPVRFEQQFTLNDDQLHIEIAVTNLGNSSMPAGLGLHPYFHRHAGMRVELGLVRVWEIDNAYLPTGVDHSKHRSIVISEKISEELAIYGSEWNGELKVSYPEGRLTLLTKAPLNHFVAFAPVNAPYVCLEPVSHLADAFNSPPSQWHDRGTHVLEPGESLAASLKFHWQPN